MPYKIIINDIRRYYKHNLIKPMSISFKIEYKKTNDMKRYKPHALKILI